MTCRNCGKEYNDSNPHCPYCAEPKYIRPRNESNSDYWWAIIAHCIAIPLSFFIVTFLFFFLELLFYAVIPAAIVSFLSLVGVIIYHSCKSNRRRIIEKQFYRDKKSICPICGSHSIALGRKGYDWNKGFWYSMFNVKGGHYLAGAESRRVTAHCQNCGHSWLTDEEWIR